MSIKKIFLLPLLLLMMFFYACRHIDTLAQRAGENGIIDMDTANAISLSARAFGDAAENMTPDQSYFLGRSVAARILDQYQIWDENPQLVKYLNLICNAIVVNSPQSYSSDIYHVAILDTDEINAFATSGGHIFITRGLLNIVNTEDTLASVIAHEVAHIQLRHSIKAIKTSRVTRAILITGTASAAAFAGMDMDEFIDIFNESVGEIFQTMVNNGYSREHEYDADNTTMCFMAAAGYNPSALIDMLRLLGGAQTGRSGLNKTHPTPGQRIYFAEKNVKRYTMEDTSLARQARFNDALGHLPENPL
jgi:predicted Zn-dependent protease